MNKFAYILFSAAGWTVAHPTAMAVDSIVVDPNGDYIITYEGYFGPQQAKWIPATKINPIVTGYVRPVTGSPDTFNYSYEILNQADSRQFLKVFRLSASHVLSPSPSNPSGWSGDVTIDFAAGSGFNVGWARFASGATSPVGVGPGETQSGFAFDSKHLAGAGVSAFYGNSPAGQSFEDSGPVPDSPIREEFDRILDTNFVTRITIVPRVSVPTPFNAATVLINIQKHLDTDLVALKLVDPAFVTQLDSWFLAGINAANVNNASGLRNAIAQLRNLLKEQYADIDNSGTETETDDKILPPKRIAKLAARVLNFDLNYVYTQVAPGDTIPPVITLTVKPARLNVAAGKLVTIRATVTANDDQTLVPAITLESITANEPLADGDISGAALGTDDRQFQLRDVRVPKGAGGRIYTITYSATDASGNKAMASATVSAK